MGAASGCLEEGRTIVHKFEDLVKHEKHTKHVGSTKAFFTSSRTVTNWQTRREMSDDHTLYDEYQDLLKASNAKYATGVSGFGPKDVLVVVDMQNDFVPKDDVNPEGGAFGVAEGAASAVVIVDLIRKAVSAKALVVATRDYHPKDHCSFTGPKNGPFPPHCIQGSKGAKFYPPIEAALSLARDEQPDRVEVVFKGFHKELDSFGGCTYGQKYFAERGLGHDLHTRPEDVTHGCCAVNWTGSFCLECSNWDKDVNAPPDVMAVLERKSLAARLTELGAERIFVCGLALDFCVLDTALNAAGLHVAPETYIVVDAARSAHIEGVGTFGSGFLSDPKDIVHKTEEQGVKLCLSAEIQK